MSSSNVVVRRSAVFVPGGSALMVVVGLLACGPTGAPPLVGEPPIADAARPPDVERERTISIDPSPPFLVPIRASSDPSRPFQHNAEVSIAAHDGNVVVASISLHHDSPVTLSASSLVRGVGLVVSHDDGETFGPAFNPGFTDAETSDPVVRVTPDGTFWVAAIGINPNVVGRGVIFVSRDGGRAFDVVHDDLVVGDKEWLAPTARNEMYMGAGGGFWKFAPNGVIEQSWTDGPDWPVFGAYADERGAHFVLGGPLIATWAGGRSIERDASLATSADGSFILVGWGSVPIGPLRGGGFWAVYNALDPNGEDVDGGGVIYRGDVRLRVFPPGASDGDETVLSERGTTAFLPAATLDGEGRLHVVWYESGAERGVLKYARSVSTDLRLGFSVARVVDPDACPGGLWAPGLTSSGIDRRLREYIDVAVDGRRVHIAWTHAPTLPARVYTSHLDF